MRPLKELFAIVWVSLSIGAIPLSMAMVYGCQAVSHEETTKPKSKPIIVEKFQYVQDPKTGLCFAYSPEGLLANVHCTVCAKVGSCRMIERFQ